MNRTEGPNSKTVSTGHADWSHVGNPRRCHYTPAITIRFGAHGSVDVVAPNPSRLAWSPLDQSQSRGLLSPLSATQNGVCWTILKEFGSSPVCPTVQGQLMHERRTAIHTGRHITMRV